MNRTLACLAILVCIWTGCEKEPPKVPPYNPSKMIINIEKIAGNGQAGLANTTLTSQLKVRVFDTLGQPLMNIPVYFGNTGIYDLSNQYGLAGGSWTIGVCGEQYLDVYARQTDGNTSDTLVFTATVSNSAIHSFSTMTDARDGNTYAIATYGNKTWMLENLSYNVPGSQLNSANPTAKYGRLYTWDQANNACPAGWHLPTTNEFDSLTYTVISCPPPISVSTAYKSETGWQNNGNNHSSFEAYPAGFYSSTFQELGLSANFWTANSSGSNADAFVILNVETGDNYFYSNSKFQSKSKLTAHSCRCVKD